MKQVILLLLIALALAIGWIVTIMNSSWRTGAGTITRHSGVTIEQVQMLSSLITTRVDVADVIETHLSGYTGSMKVALLVKGDFLLGVDLAQAKFESVNETAHTAVVVLPQPTATSPRLDHERTRVFLVDQSGLWQLAPGGGQTSGDLIDRGYLDAQRFVTAACSEPSVLARSRRQAEQVVPAFFRAIGWDVSVRWQK